MKDSVSKLIARCKALSIKKPQFEHQMEGEKHKPTFSCDVIIKGEIYATGRGNTKQSAKKNACSEALARMEEDKSWPDGLYDVKENIIEDEFDDLEEEYSVKENIIEPLEEEFEGDEGDQELDGAWPMLSDLLSNCLKIANERVNSKLKGTKAINEIQFLALTLYKDCLEDLGAKDD